MSINTTAFPPLRREAVVLRSVAYAAASAPGTPASLVETVLESVVVPANLLSRDGDSLIVSIWGTTAANANNKTMRFYFGAQFPATLGPFGFNNQNWLFDLLFVRNSSTTAEVGRNTYIGTSFFPLANAVPTLDFTVANTVSLTGQNGTAVANDIRLRGFRVRFEPAQVG